MSKRGLSARLYPNYQAPVRVNFPLPKGIFNCVKCGPFALERRNLAVWTRKTARLRGQTGGSDTVRPFGGITPDGYSLVETRIDQLCGGWSFGGVDGRLRCCAMKASNSSLSLA